MSGPALDTRGLPLGHPFDPEWEVTPRELRDALRPDAAGERPLVIDCRTPDEHTTARIEGSLLVPMDQLGARLVDLREHEDRAIVVYCHHGRRSLRVTAHLRQAGFERAKSMAGGIDLWSIDIDPAVPRY